MTSAVSLFALDRLEQSAIASLIWSAVKRHFTATEVAPHSTKILVANEMSFFLIVEGCSVSEFVATRNSDSAKAAAPGFSEYNLFLAGRSSCLLRLVIVR